MYAFADLPRDKFKVSSTILTCMRRSALHQATCWRRIYRRCLGQGCDADTYYGARHIRHYHFWSPGKLHLGQCTPELIFGFLGAIIQHLRVYFWAWQSITNLHSPDGGAAPFSSSWLSQKLSLGGRATPQWPITLLVHTCGNLASGIFIEDVRVVEVKRSHEQKYMQAWEAHWTWSGVAS